MLIASFLFLMIAALLTAFLFSLSALFGGKSARVFGPARANLGRVIVALFCLGMWAMTFGHGWQGAGFGWLLLSGCIGFGFGDMALFGALPLLGARLTILLTQCLAGPIAGLAEWFWLGQKIPLSQILAAAVILVGVLLALAPGRNPWHNRRHYLLGIFFGLLSALGQGLGAVVSRRAVLANTLAATPIDGGTAAFQRMLGGFAITVLCYFLFRSMRKETAGSTRGWFSPGWHLILLNGLVGPSLGVGFYQYALANTPSALVLAIVATSPVIVMLLEMLAGEEKPGLVSVLGGIVAVAGAVALAVSKH